mmetsp:Transcript_32326/g.61862  ORF Transcript_32326/g.61862 Transcript_32326/m.61862 type:complete len:114 (-) Transcript_32326:113-454(-)
MNRWTPTIATLATIAMPNTGHAFVSNTPAPARSTTNTGLYMASQPSIGVFFGTSTGNTEEAAYFISAEFGDIASEPIEIDAVQGSVAAEFGKFDSLVVGTPTWNTGENYVKSR